MAEHDKQTQQTNHEGVIADWMTIGLGVTERSVSTAFRVIRAIETGARDAAIAIVDGAHQVATEVIDGSESLLLRGTRVMSEAKDVALQATAIVVRRDENDARVPLAS